MEFHQAHFEGTLLSARAVTKRFPGVHALDSVDLELRPGECHALMGQNGAGKSTLLKIITGALRPDGGAMSLAGRPFDPHSPPDAQRQGVAAVYQEVGLVPTLSVAENLFLARFPLRAPWLINRRRIRLRAEQMLAEFGLNVDPGIALGSLPIAVQQMVAIARAIDMDARLLVLDEPTSSLGPRETEALFGVMARLKSRGLAILFVTHFLDQVYRVADRITVLRNGINVGTFAAGDVPRFALVAHMLGRDPARAHAVVGGPSGPKAAPASPALTTEARPALRARGLGRRGAVHPFDLELPVGRVVGLAGLLGSGRTEAARLLFGADRHDSGAIEIEGRPASLRSPRAAVARRVAFCPEDRKADGLFASMSIRDNIVMVVQRTLSRLGFVSRRAHRRIAEDLIVRLGIVTPDADRPAGVLSGGNQQKVILARWLAAHPRILILDEPTRGIDVGAKAEIERLIADLACRGIAILFVSSEIEEVVRVSHKVSVLRDRKVVARLEDDGVTEPAVMAAIVGGADQ